MSAATALAVPRRQAVEQLQWLCPAPLWDSRPIGAASSGLAQPWIAELRSDSFVTDFLALVAGSNGASPAGLGDRSPHRTVGAAVGAPYRLFQPLSQCYYLVAASLVCRRPGIPDHAVRRKNGERTSFVMRLIADGTEQAWVPDPGVGAPGAPDPGSPPSGHWVAATPALALVPGEEKLRLHPAPVGAFAAPGTTAAALGMAAGTDSTRTVHYGYIPVGRRERFVPALSNPVAAVAAFVPPVNTGPENPWYYELVGRVINPWSAIAKKPPTNYGFPSLFLLLDLAQWIARYLPRLNDAITKGTTVTGAQHDLLNLLQTTMVVKVVKNVTGSIAISAAIKELQPYLPLVTGQEIAGPPDTYNLSTSAPPANLGSLARAALTDAAQEPGYHADVPPELSGMIKIDPITPPAGMKEPIYIIRAVFEHDPCAPVLSEPSHQFVLGRPMDPDAPARKIRIQLPDVANLRQFQRGVALEMPASVRKVVDALTPDALKGDITTNGVQLGMICSFSLQIIFLCAFIVLFIFLLLLNIVFWWMPFLKICFPIPVKSATHPGPQP